MKTAVQAATEKQEGEKNRPKAAAGTWVSVHAGGASTLIWSFHAVGQGQCINCSSAVSDVPANSSTTAGANKVSRIRRRTYVSLISSASAISATEPSRSSGVIDDTTIHALNDRQAKRKIMLWASGSRLPRPS